MILFCEEQAGLLEPVAVEIVGVLEDLADGLNVDVLGENVLTLSLDGLNVVAVGELIRVRIIKELTESRS